MTLTRTIRRRETRKRAAQRRARWAAGPRQSFLAGDWLVKEQLADLTRKLNLAKLFSREYR